MNIVVAVLFVGAELLLGFSQLVEGYGTRAGTCRAGRSIGADSGALHGLDGSGGLGDGGFALQLDGVSLEERPSTANAIAIGPQTVRIGVVSVDGSTTFKGFLVRVSEKSGQSMADTLTLTAENEGQILPSTGEEQGPLSSCATTVTAYSHSERSLKTSTEVEFLTPAMTADLTLEVTVVVNNQGTGSDEWHYSEFDLAVTGDDGGGEVDTTSPTVGPSAVPTPLLAVETPGPTTEGPTTTAPTTLSPTPGATTPLPSPGGTTPSPSPGGTTAVPSTAAPTTSSPTVSPSSPSTTLLPTESGTASPSIVSPVQATTTDSPTAPPTFVPTISPTAIPTPLGSDGSLGQLSLLFSLFTREPTAEPLATDPPTIPPSPVVDMTSLPTPADATPEPTPADATPLPTTPEPSEQPTAEATAKPTRDNIFRSKRPTRAPVAEGCADQSKPRFKVVVDYLARWSCRVVRQADEWVRRFYCRQVKRAEKLCPVACGTCRRQEDNPSTGRPCRDKRARWSLRVVESRGCGWLSLQDDARKRQLCRQTERMRVLCPVTCGTCDDLETSSSEEL